MEVLKNNHSSPFNRTDKPPDAGLSLRYVLANLHSPVEPQHVHSHRR